MYYYYNSEAPLDSRLRGKRGRKVAAVMSTITTDVLSGLGCEKNCGGGELA